MELQTFNARDIERMKREMQAVERDISEAEIARNSWEDKSWDLDSTIGQKFKELRLQWIATKQLGDFVSFSFAFVLHVYISNDIFPTIIAHACDVEFDFLISLVEI